MKNIKRYLPETYLIAATLFYWISETILINWFAIGLLALLTTLIVTKNKVLGIVIASIWIVTNLYMVLALLSELSEFTEFNNKALQLLAGGTLFLGLNLMFSVMLLVKNARGSVKNVRIQNS